jgi:predicted nucleic acid-binding protein
MKPKIYLDTCSIQRPLDSKSQLRVRLEAEAVLGILSLVERDQIDLVSSEVLLFEINRNSNQIRQEYGQEVMLKAKTFVRASAKVERRSKQFHKLGLKPLDAVHLASAEEAKANYFCTCDDDFLKKTKKIQGLKTKVVSPLELAEEISK